jgi:hypothetical protein
VIAACRVLQIVALALWVGAVVFFSFVTAPSLFAALPREMAGRATAAIFPRYYALGWICGGVASVAVVVPWLLGDVPGRRSLVLLAMLGSMLGVSLYAGRVVLPRASAARMVREDPSRAAEHEAAKVSFDRLHRRSVALNGTVLLLGLAALAVAALPSRSVLR